ncbi:carboxypeptidase activation peptide [Ancylostoma duodenale]|uniref:Carboxypeptidase activation peptide n=1 Tax=Ancylostoma duodenale TaxID=51022 RepID=A0A0C2FQE5_9BILA|nr:carboxypeptidase activation peptide [Ancylostoma duodenale]
MISNRLVVVVLSSLLVWTSAKKFSVLRLKPSTKADVDFLHDLYMNDVKLDFWKSPTEPGKEVHVMLNDESEENFLMSLDARNISHSVMIEDVKNNSIASVLLLQRQSNTISHKVAVQRQSNSICSISATA